MKKISLLLTICFVIGYVLPTVAQSNFETSLHKTRNGKATWYNAENGGFETITNVPINQVGCVECHDANDANGDPYPATGYEPDCVDCHNVHAICDPSLAKFRKSSVGICANCHTDSEVMQKYGLETNVLDTYMVFHGTTITLLEDYDPDSLTNKPTCYDCHGIHEVGSETPPTIEANISAMTLYPDVAVKQAGPPVENVGVTGVMIGILIGSIGALTINQLIKERKNDLFEE